MSASDPLLASGGLLSEGPLEILDVISLVCLGLGALLSLAAGVGLMRFSDVLMRMHAQTKPQIAGLMFLLIGLAVQQTHLPTILFLIPIMFFQMLTTPAGATMLARAGYRSRQFDNVPLYADELAAAVESAQRRTDDELTRAHAVRTGQPEREPAPEHEGLGHGEK
ncbi:monovalent cation/H(+) antiporter subunit G [Pseudoclavibacter sp. AY1H1]|uniref:monovalent cation/H(+) antiporter subunit G n=1 Tax=Pseudoclavibacter sp. AY1H1 TaxID=2080584 RepID=UPI000CE74663|nr:monovalent cation/H(+) antiporter subunit G [Pseudoclavibacter sp. AY1H1]PPF32984.1 Na+/H+ antiporter subunit G [Pseudoclavibacter sp. AY1H1]